MIKKKHYTIIMKSGDEVLEKKKWPLPWGFDLIKQHFEKECMKEDRFLKIEGKIWDVLEVRQSGSMEIEVFLGDAVKDRTEKEKKEKSKRSKKRLFEVL